MTSEPAATGRADTAPRARRPGRCAAGDDPALFHAIEAEARRQEAHIELIASENYVSGAVLAAQGSVLTNKYADGYPGRRTYRGCEHVDTVEALAIERAKRLFGAGYANVQPYSGSQANMAVYLALLEPGDTVLAMRPAHGGHRTHGDAANFSGKLYRTEHYGVDPTSGLIDYDAARDIARQVRPKLIVAGFSAYSRVVDWHAFRRIADEVGARLLADIAHVAGLIAAGLHPSPIGIADVITTTTHKTLRGPRGGMILAGDDDALGGRLDAAVFPGIQGGPLMHVIAAKAAALHEAAQPEFREYQAAVLDNARRLGERLAARGLALAAGGTDNHMLLVALGDQVDGASAERALERAHIAVNGVTMPTARGMRSALRLGTPAVTTRGFGPAEIETVGDWVAAVVESPDSDAVAARVRDGARDLLARFPVYG